MRTFKCYKCGRDNGRHFEWMCDDCDLKDTAQFGIALTLSLAGLGLVAWLVSWCLEL